MPLKLLLHLSGRNLFRHKRRNIMLLLAIIVAVAGVTASNSLIRGFQYDLQEAAVVNLTGHVKSALSAASTCRWCGGYWPASRSR